MAHDERLLVAVLSSASASRGDRGADQRIDADPSPACRPGVPAGAEKKGPVAVGIDHTGWLLGIQAGRDGAGRRRLCWRSAGCS